MKTIEEAAKQYVSDKTYYSDFEKVIVDRAFKAGAEFAQKWISVEENVPVFTGDAYQVLVKGHKNNPERIVIWTVGISENESILKKIFTHWRNINIE